MQKALDAKFKGLETKVIKLEDKNKNLRAKNKELAKQGVTLNEALKAQGEQLAKLLRNDKQLEETLGKQIDEFFDKNKEQIKQAFKSGKVIEFKSGDVNKTITTQSGGYSGVAPNGIGFNPVNFHLANYDYIYELVSVFETNQANLPYTEMIPGDEDYEEVAEGATKSEIKFTWNTEYSKYIKIAAWVRLTEEVVKDVKRLKSLAKEYLYKKHNIKKARAILDYAIAQANTFVAGDLAQTITDPTFFDVINASAMSIMLKENYHDDDEAYANVILVNPVDFLAEIVSAKKNNGDPMFPSATIYNRLNIGGMLVVPHKNIMKGEIFVADMSLVNVGNYEGYGVRIGWINDDFIKNQFVMLGESKFHRYIKNQDNKAFMKDVVAVIKQAITKP